MALTKLGFGDSSQGSQNAGVIPAGGIRIEVSDITDADVSASNYIPTQMSNVVAVVGQMNHALTCASGGIRGFSNWDVSVEGQIDISILDVTVGTSGTTLSVVAFGW
jgi:hypothetical protein